jgi:hypothetical protein
MATFNPSSFYRTRRDTVSQAAAGNDSNDELDSDVEQDSDGLPDLDNDSDVSFDAEDIVLSDHDTDSEVGTSDDEDGDNDEVPEDDDTFMTAKSGRKWSFDPPRQRRTAAVNIVTEQEGVNPDVAQCVETISDSFGVYMTDKMIEDVVRYTNQHMDTKYADGVDQTNSAFRHTDLVELKALLGLLISIGASKGRNENVSDLWQEGPFSRPFFRAVMGRNRFQWLLRSLRFDNKETRAERLQTDKLAAISGIWNDFIGNCLDSYRPGPFCTIDEHMVGFRGRCSFIMYLPSKPDKYGIKVFALVCSHCFYLYNAKIYTGKEGTQPVRDLGSKTVLTLTEPIMNSCRNITMDNWFTSVPLAEKLLEKKLTCVGTIKKNKPDIPQKFLPQRGRAELSSLFGFEDDKTLVSFVPKKNKAVILLSTMHRDAAVDPVTSKPDIILFYNQTKGGVDTCDQMIKSMTVKRKSRRWPQIIFYRIVDFACLNSFIVWRTMSPQSTIRRRDYQMELAMELAKPYIIRRSQIPELRKSVTRAMEACGIDLPVHRPIAPVVDDKLGKRRRCHMCPRQLERKIRQMCKRCKRPVCSEHSDSVITCRVCTEGEEESN